MPQLFIPGPTACRAKITGSAPSQLRPRRRDSGRNSSVQFEKAIWQTGGSGQLHNAGGKPVHGAQGLIVQVRASRHPFLALGVADRTLEGQ